MESSRRDLLNDMVEHMPILKKKAPPPFWFHYKNRYSIPQNGDFFYCAVTI